MHCVYLNLYFMNHLLRNLIPLEFLDDILIFVNEVQTTAWPKQNPVLESAIANLSECTHDYVQFFETRSEYRHECLCENVDYKRIFPNPHYHEEVEAAKAWDRGVFGRLINIVVAINNLFDKVRENLNPTYRLRNGRLGIYDALGVRMEAPGMIFYPNEYVELTEE